MKGHQLKYCRWLSTQAHGRDLSIALKGSYDLMADLVNQYDCAIVESCNAYDECKFANVFIAAEKAVFAISFTEKGPFSQRDIVCPLAHATRFDWILKSGKLDGVVERCSSYMSPVALPIIPKTA